MNYRRRPRRDPEAAPPERTPPSAIDIERQLLMSAISDPEIIPELLTELDPAMFYAPRSADLARAIIKLHAVGEPIDVATVSQELNPKNISASDLIGWADNCLPSQWRSYLAIVKKLHFARNFI